MASNISNLYNSRFRLSGMASGLDTDSIVQQMMKVERMKVDKIKQDKQLLEWKRDDYRTIINSLRSFRDEYFDVLKPSTNFRSASAFASYDTKSDNESIATVSAGAGAVSTTHELYVTQLATAATVTSTAAVTGTVNGSNAASLSLQGKQIDITLDGIKKTISLEDYSSTGDMQIKLQTAIDTAFGKTNTNTSKLNVLVDSLSGKVEFSPGLQGSTFALSETPNNFIASLGFSSNKQNYITGAAITATDMSSLNGNFKVSLGGVEKELAISGLTSSSTLSDVRTKIQEQLDASFGIGKVAVSLNGSKLEFITQTGERLALSAGSTSSNLAGLGITDGASTTGTSSTDIDLSENEKGKSFILNINGTDKTITLSADYTDMAALSSAIQSQLGTDVSVGVSGSKLVFSTNNASKVVFKQGPTDSLSNLGFAATDNVSNKVSLTSSLDSIEKHLAAAPNFNATANVQFTINGTTINLNKTYAQATLNDVMTAINTSAAGVEMKYDALKDKFTLTSKATGVTAGINITDTDPINGLFKSIGVEQVNVQAAKDAIFSLDGVTDMQRSSNEFTINGVTYNLKSQAPSTKVTITVNANPDGLVDKIKGFVAKYNELLDKVNGELSEKRERDYLPLTDEQKEAMNELDVKNWEEKARSGMLSNDSLLNNTVASMRNALIAAIPGGSTTLAQIGITTGPYYMKGKLVIDETKLKTAIKDNIDGVVQLFTKESTVTYNDVLNDPTKRQTRFNESGLAERLNDIIQDNIRTTRDANGKKGLLIEKAGINSDVTDTRNAINDLINEKDELISKMLDKLATKENSLYQKFAALEKAMSQMNSQSSWMSQQLG